MPPEPSFQPPENPSLAENPNSTVDDEMANFPVNPQPFLIAGLTVDHRWNRLARGRVVLGGEPTREHEDYPIVTLNPMP